MAQDKAKAAPAQDKAKATAKQEQKVLVENDKVESGREPLGAGAESENVARPNRVVRAVKAEPCSASTRTVRKWT